ncbi:MAG TPA: hypothetical protein PLJ26_00775 [Candidatus Omnitrophota bacterium]|nr:hypothetical protein [Candidatus Omnitrophota bacterium]HQJ15007.1 hypothetical protein [Candidatus Omnitrophota bacterium]
MTRIAHRQSFIEIHRLVVACLVIFFASLACAQPEGKVVSSEKTGSLELTLQIKAKRQELKEVEGRIKALRREQRAQMESERVSRKAQLQTSLETLRLTDPQKYEQAVAEKFKREKEREMSRRAQADVVPARPRITHSEWLDQLKSENPSMYDLVLKKDILEAEIRSLCMMRDSRRERRPE